MQTQTVLSPSHLVLDIFQSHICCVHRTQLHALPFVSLCCLFDTVIDNDDLAYDFFFLCHIYYKSKKDNSTMIVVKVLDIFVVFPTLFQNLDGKARNALIKWIVHHICI